MEAKQRPCTCDGSNSNCARCFGTGVMQLPGPAPRKPVVIPRETPKPTPPLIRSAKAPRAPIYMMDSNRHDWTWRQKKERNRRVQGVGRQVAHNLAARKQEVEPESVLRRELIKAGIIKPASDQDSTNVASPRRGQECPLCGTFVGCKKYARHKRACSKARQDRSSTSGRAMASTMGSASPLPHRAVPSEAYVKDFDDRDANRHVGFVIRENGKYGSHPLHDRFDDDSTP
jgi:hypothetical protein